MKTGCVVVAAGRGKRAGLTYNKVFYNLCGKTVLERCLEALCQSGRIDEIVPVINKDDGELYRKLGLNESAGAIVKAPVFGGASRRDSVYAGLKALSPDTDIVLVHDAARPFVTDEIILSVISDAERFGSGVISCPAIDTLKLMGEGLTATGTLDRSKVRSVQTPQAFNYKKLLRAHEALPQDENATDDAYLYEKIYGSVKLTHARGAKYNIKLTDPEDFIMAEERLGATFRIGTGYDVHRLVEGRRLVLCGVEIPYEKGLLGHSDADVATHALIDALLGAAALGDIGRLFPDSDDSYKDISSLVLLKRTLEVLKSAGYEPSNVDVTIVCQRPKLAPYIDAMKAKLAQTLCMDAQNVSVKATTTEMLGFEGEGLGISAQSVASVRKAVF